MRVRNYTIDLREQMAVCDANYIRLLKLLGNTLGVSKRVIALPHLGVQGSEEQVSVCIEVLEKFKYTSTVSVSQRLEHGQAEDSAFYKRPEIIIRAYHDAKTAEVTSYQNHKYFKAMYPVPNQFMYQCNEKEQLNLFLAEWLNLCMEEGLGHPEEIPVGKLMCLDVR